MPLIVSLLVGGLCATGVGVLFGIPSLRIKGLYLAVATLAAQFFVVWCLAKIGWFSNYSSSGVITAQTIVLFGSDNGPEFRRPWRGTRCSCRRSRAAYPRRCRRRAAAARGNDRR